MDQAEIIKELESLMRASNKLRHRLDDLIYDSVLENYMKEFKELDPCCIELQKIAGDIQENISWYIQWLMKEIDPDWDVHKYLKETNYG